MIKIDWDIVANKLKKGCSGTRIADFLGVHENTLYKRCKKEQGVEFVAYKAQKKAEGNIMIHEKQFDVAMDGNVSMLIWLGKQYLGQTDKSDHTSGGEKLQQPIQITVAAKETTDKIKKLIDESMLN